MTAANKKEEKFTDFFTAGVRLISQNNPMGVIYLLLAIVFSGTEACKIIFRHKFKKEALGIRQIVTSALLFGGWAYLCYYLKPEDYPEEFSIDNKGFMLEVSTLVYSLLGVFVLVKGLLDLKESDSGIKVTLLGESMFLGFLRSSEWTEERIKSTAEPLILIAIGLPITILNVFLGSPLLFLGVSSFIFNLFDPPKEQLMTSIQDDPHSQDFEESAR